MGRSERLDVPTLDEKCKSNHVDGTLSLPRQGVEIQRAGEQSAGQNRFVGVGVRAGRSFLL